MRALLASSCCALAGLALTWLACLASLSGCAAGDVADAGPDHDDDDGDALLSYVDAGIPERPAPPPDAGVEECLPVAPLPDESLPRCTAETRTCVQGCASDDDACRNACWAADTTPALGDTACANCIFNELLACLDADGCRPQVARYLCCVLDACAQGGAGCDQACAPEANDMFLCGVGRAPACLDVTGGDIGRCYAP